MRKKKSSADLPWYEKDLPWDEEELLWGLYDASMELKQLPLLGQIMALKAIARHLRRRVPDGLLEPLESIYTDLMNEAAAMTSDDKPGPHPAPLDRRDGGSSLSRNSHSSKELRLESWGCDYRGRQENRPRPRKTAILSGRNSSRAGRRTRP